MPGNLVSSAPGGGGKSKSKGKLQMKAPNQAPVRSGQGVSKGAKRKHRDDAGVDADEDDSMGEDEDDDENEEEADTDEEIERAQQQGKSKKTAKRKRRATSPTTFGAALQGLLGPPPASTSVSAGAVETTGGEHDNKKRKSVTRQNGQDGKQAPNTILSLAPHVRRSAQSSVLNAKAARLALEARKKREDRAHVEDVIGGWGPPGRLPKTEEGEEKQPDDEPDDAARSWLSQGGAQGYEKRLRKVAQRGVVKLFNAIRAAQNTNEADYEDVTKKNQSSDNVLGSKAKAAQAHSKSSFLDAIRSSKT
ncbi:hypothetical protein FA10DRAFT_301557 [Acaromyces ingoldii]|uniref:Rrp15p-domain-containing protein n=1 Tax=Acaromyces ingoldii TaxID=215250 RepID=A0A316YMJ3_9BASI|nr:hypothetical protein FA10DRAFT_301557 [Acaromyces ingoldii]PWN90286.1 hypothetical protein FA10DRAFT_301557 [Acaromyces ingoldii]